MSFHGSLLHRLKALATLAVLSAFVIDPALLAQKQSSSSVSGTNAVYQRGLAAWQSGDLASTHVAFESMVKANPRNVDAQNAFGQVLWQQGNLDAAISHLQAVTRLRPDLAIGHVYLGQALAQQGALTDAAS